MATLNKYTVINGNNNWIYTPVVISSLNRMLMGVGR